MPWPKGKPRAPNAGRRKGTPNKATADARAAFAKVYEGRLDDLDRWLRETGDGFPAIHFLSDGTQCKYTKRDPGKAADILTRMAEHFVPKLQRIEKLIIDASDEELLQEIRRRRAEALAEAKAQASAEQR